MVENAAERALRLLDLVPYLKANPGVTFAEICKEFGISRKELTKDLFLLFMCGLPGYTGYELIDLSFDDDIVFVQDAQNLDAPRRFTEAESLFIRLALAGLAEVLPNSHRAQIDGLRAKIASMSSVEIPESAIEYHGDREQRILRTLQEALDSGRMVKIEYYNQSRDERSERLISPIEILFESERTLVEAWCELSAARRTFLLSAIESCVPSDQPAHIGETASEEELEVTIDVEPGTAFLAEHAQALRPMGNNRYELKIYQPAWLVRSALAEANQIEVISPATLRGDVAMAATAALSNYRN